MKKRGYIKSKMADKKNDIRKEEIETIVCDNCNKEITELQSGGGKMVVKDIEKFKALCKPVVDYIAENGDPYTEVHISMDKIDVTSVECGIPLIPEYYERERGADGKLRNNMDFNLESIEPGYDEIRSILSDQVAIRFFVPCHEWNELATSKEWKAFQALLEKCQIKQPQKRRLTAEYQQEV